MRFSIFRFSVNVGLYLLFLFVSVTLIFDGTVGIFHRLDLNENLKDPLKYYYSRFFRHVDILTRNIIQYQSDCARYDKFLYYTLRTGTCIFKNEEFETTVDINSLGLRDDEMSLENPEIIFLGDSMAMGWGVQQEETFPQVFENITGIKTLNGGGVGYGTVRQLRTLEKLKLNKTQHIIIQYSNGYFEENKSFFESGFLKISSQEKYNKRKEKYERDKKYYPGKYSRVFVNLLRLKIESKIRSLGNKSKTLTDENIEARYFLNALEKFINSLEKERLNLPSPGIIVFSITTYNKNNSKFIRDLSHLIEGTPLESLVSTVDISGIFTQEDYFSLDPHINNKGHKKIARFLSDKYFRNNPQREIIH